MGLELDRKCWALESAESCYFRLLMVQSQSAGLRDLEITSSHEHTKITTTEQPWVKNDRNLPKFSSPTWIFLSQRGLAICILTFQVIFLTLQVIPNEVVFQSSIEKNWIRDYSLSLASSVLRVGSRVWPLSPLPNPPPCLSSWPPCHK